MKSPVCIIANARSGRKKAERLHELLGPLDALPGGAPELRLIRHGRDLPAAARQAVAEGFGTLIAAGGDGTVCAVASAVAGTGCTLGVIPLGTFNYFARRIGLPLQPEAAVAALPLCRPQPMPAAEVNGEVFLNNASLGLYPAVLRSREAIYRRWGRSRLAAYWSVLRTLADFRTPAVMKVTVDGAARRLRTPMVFVAANAYQLDQFGLPGQECLERGEFAIFLAPDCTRLQLLGFALRVALRSAQPGRDYEMLCGRRLQIETAKPRRVVARDGERARMQSPFRFELRPGALNVLVPDPTPQDKDDQKAR